MQLWNIRKYHVRAVEVRDDVYLVSLGWWQWQWGTWNGLRSYFDHRDNKTDDWSRSKSNKDRRVRKSFQISGLSFWVDCDTFHWTYDPKREEGLQRKMMASLLNLECLREKVIACVYVCGGGQVVLFCYCFVVFACRAPILPFLSDPGFYLWGLMSSSLNKIH